jgi:hypothetical protein
MQFLVTNFQSPLTGEQPPVEDKGPPQGVSLDTFAGPVHVRMGYRGGADATWAIAVLHRFSESGRPVRRFHCGLPSTLYEPERAEKTRRVGNDNAVDVCLGTSVMLT